MLKTLNNIRLLDDLARGETYLHRLHPLAKLLVILVFLVSIISFDRYEVMGLLPFGIYPIYLLVSSDSPMKPILMRVFLVAPFVISIGILNPIFDRGIILIDGFAFSRGWLTFFSILVKSILTISVGIMLIATTGIEKLSGALRALKIPKVFVLQILLTYRYISVLIEEVGRMQRAYALRAPGQKGIQRSAWGSFAGQLILRTFERAQRVYESMILRGFDGDYQTGESKKMNLQDVLFVFGWCAFFILSRTINLPLLIGNILTGVIR